MTPSASDKKQASGTNIRIPPDLHAKLLDLSGQVPGSSVNSIGVEMIRDIIRMSETPEDERSVPKTVTLIDAVTKASHTLLKKAKEKP